MAQLHYPISKKVNQTDDYFGTKVHDPYRWLEYDTATDTKEWVNAQQNFTESYIAKIPFRAIVRKKVESVFGFARFTTGFKAGDYIFFAKTDGLQNQAVYYYQKGLTGIPEVFLDPNTLSKDGTAAVSIGGVSNDKKYIEYHVNQNGTDWCTSYFKEIATNKLMKDTIKWVRDQGIGWVKEGFYYVGYPAPEKGKELTAVAKHATVYFHKWGDNQAQDKIIYTDANNPDIYLTISTSDDNNYLFISKYPGTDNNEIIGKQLTGEGDFKVLFKGYTHQYEIISNKGDTLFVKTNEGAGNGRIIKTTFGNPNKETWVEVVSEKKQKLDFATLVGNTIFTGYLVNATSKIYQYNTNGKLQSDVTLPGLGTAGGFGGSKGDAYVFYDYTSYTAPPSIYKYDIGTGKSSIFKQSVFNVDVNKYETNQIVYTSKDGTQIPMFLVHKKGLQKSINTPTLLYAYGGFDISITPAFWSHMYTLLDNDGILAVANIRGGGEFGEEWHKAGMLDKKQNVFDDFIAAADYLVAEKYTSRNKLAIMGRSNGGLLIGAVITQRPDICKVAFPTVGVMDMLRFQKYTSGVFWTPEYGSSDSATQFPFLFKYSPLHNIKQVNYPATMVMTADHDDRVVPMHSFKFAATLQEKQSGSNPILIRISTNQGHHDLSLAKNIDTWSDIFSFMFYNLKIKPKG